MAPPPAAAEDDEDDDKQDATQGGSEAAAPAAPAPPSRAPEEEVQYVRTPMPDETQGEMFAIANQLMGGSRMRVMCEDGQSRLARVRGKHKRRMWIREGDLLIVRPWDFQDEKADVTYRFTRVQALQLKRRNRIPEHLDVF